MSAKLEKLEARHNALEGKAADAKKVKEAVETIQKRLNTLECKERIHERAVEQCDQRRKLDSRHVQRAFSTIKSALQDAIPHLDGLR